MIPVAKRSPSKSPSGELERQYKENVSLIAKVAKLERQIDNLERELDAVRRAWREAETWRREQQAVVQQPLQVHQITEDMRQRMVLQAQAQQQIAQQNQGLAQQNFYGQGLSQLGLLGQQSGAQAWPDWADVCMCVPGRGGFLRGDN